MPSAAIVTVSTVFRAHRRHLRLNIDGRRL